MNHSIPRATFVEFKFDQSSDLRAIVENIRVENTSWFFLFFFCTYHGDAEWKEVLYVVKMSRACIIWCLANGHDWCIKRTYGSVTRVFLLFLARNRLLQGSFHASSFPVRADAVSFPSKQCRTTFRGTDEFSRPALLNFPTTPKIWPDGEWPWYSNRHKYYHQLVTKI